MENQERIFFLDDKEYKYEEQSMMVQATVTLLDEVQEKRQKLIKKLTCVDASMRGLQMNLSEIIEHEKSQKEPEEEPLEEEVTEVH
jgi:hypothetical protein|tara:strand:- start:1392 stop:1649 length:258 start_codon:yes stop_codon:yes gene_type:complete